jgi:hypothetical protein
MPGRSPLNLQGAEYQPETEAQELMNLPAEEQARRSMAKAVETLPASDRYVLRSYLRGARLAQTAYILGRTPRWTRAKLDAARRPVR